ncbi:MAG TPA: hypothetical protein VFC63_15270 [Blastocatellia bacterium]|nr:hypothetical protein [Blastocatellia bacterium]
MSSKTDGKLPAFAAPYALAVAARILALLLSLVIDDPRIERNTQLLFIGAVFVPRVSVGLGRDYWQHC